MACFHLLRCKESTAHSGRMVVGRKELKDGHLCFPWDAAPVQGETQNKGKSEVEEGWNRPRHFCFFERKQGVFLLKILSAVNSHFLTEECFYLKSMGAFTLRSLCQWEKMSCFEREPVPRGLRQRLCSIWISEFQASAKRPICSTEQQTSYKKQ